MNYFKDCTTLDQAKNLFKKLCIKLHPDTSGFNSYTDFVAMHAEFKQSADRLKFATGFDKDKDFNADRFYDMVKAFDGLTDININFIGAFIWLTDSKHGAMYQQRDLIKGIKIHGYNVARWANKKKSWYFSPIDYKQKSRSNKDLIELGAKYGRTVYQSKGNILITN